jgi:uncharacterized phage protein gp47/JayE
MPTYGLLPQGFLIPTLEDLKGLMEADYQAAFGAGVNLEPESNNGQQIGIFCERLAEAWEALLDTYSATDPDQATGTSQDAVMALSGAVRAGAQKSTGLVAAVGTVGTVLSTGRVFSVVGTLARFDTSAPATLATLPAWASLHTYAVNAMVQAGGNAYLCTSPGTSASSGGPTGTGTTIADGTVVWRFLNAGTAGALVPVVAEVAGPTPANAWSLTTIETAVAGLSYVGNPQDATPGTNVESDAAARMRRENELQTSGNARLEAIRTAIFKADSTVVSATVFENDDPVNTNADGMPPNSVEAVVRGGTTATLLAAVFGSKGGGIKAYGNTSGTVLDSEGGSHTVAFSTPTDVLAYLDVVLTTDTNFPADGIAQVKQALADWGAATYQVGDDVVRSKLYAPIFTVAGIVDVTVLHLGLSAWPTLDANLVTTGRQLARLDTSRIRVNGV